MGEVIATDEFVAWFGTLDAKDSDAVGRSIERLESEGATLAFPHSSAIKGTEFPLRELRVQSGGRPFRLFYAFDAARDVVLLIGGDKTGDDRFYERMVPRAEKIWKEYLAENFAR